MTFQIEVDDALLKKALKEAPAQMRRNIPTAGLEALREVIETQGVRNYPPETEANHPPTPYYVRGMGTQYASRNAGNSEQYGKSWTETASGYMAKAEAGASYGVYVGGEYQPAHMAAKGWRKVADVLREKMNTIKRIYEKWIEYSLRQAGF